MSPTAMLTLIFAAFAMFAWSASRRWQLLQIGRPGEPPRPHRRRACAARGGTRFARRRWTTTTRPGWPTSSSSPGSSSSSSRTLMLWGRGFYPPFNLLVLGPDAAARRGLRVRRRTSSARSSSCGVARLLLLPRHRQAEAHVAALEGLAHPRDHLTMMVADMTYDGAALVLASTAGARSARGGAATRARDAQCAAHRDHHRPARRRALRRRVVVLAVAGGLVLRGAPPRALARRRSSWIAHVGLLDALDARPRLPEPPPALEALPRHHGDPERLPRGASSRAGRLEPMAENAEKLMEKVGAAARGGRPAGAARSASRASSTSRGRRSSTSTRAPSAGAARTTARRTARARSSARSTSRSRSATTSTSAKKSSSRTATRTARRRDAAADGAEAPRARRAPSRQADQPRPERHPPGRPLGVHECRACEEQCPVLISYVDKIVDMRRNLVMVKGEFPHELAKPFQGDGGRTATRGTSRAWTARRGPTGSASRRWREARRRRSSTGSAARRATTTARRRSRARRRSSSSRRASTSRSSGRKRTARATRRGARATSSSSRCSPRATRRRSTATRSRAA